jgi:hypothetical protein
MATELDSQRSPIGGTVETAWPRSESLNHLLLIIASCPSNGSKEQEELLKKISKEAPSRILGNQIGAAEVNPAGLEPSYHDVKAVCIAYVRLVVASTADVRISIGLS